MERFDLRLPVLISVIDTNGEDQTLKSTSRNICAGGAFVELAKPLSIGTDVEIKMILPFDKAGSKGTKSSIKVSGSVIRCERKGMALSFDKNYSIVPYQ